MSATQETVFQEKIDAELKIEPKDWMPDKYRKHLIRQKIGRASRRERV